MKIILTAFLILAISIGAKALPQGSCGACITVSQPTSVTSSLINTSVLTNQTNKNVQTPALPTFNQLSPNAGSSPNPELLNTANIDDNTHLSAQ